jgi:hypothetical protein
VRDTSRAILSADHCNVWQMQSMPTPASTRIRKALAASLLVLGLSLCVGDILLNWHLRKVSPTFPSPSTGEVVKGAKGRFFITKDAELLQDILFPLGIIVAGLGGRLWTESIRLR